MNTSFFTIESGFQKSLVNTSNNIGKNKDYTTSLQKDEFKTTRSDKSSPENYSKNYSKNDVEESEQNKKFNDIMKSLKKKESAKISSAPLPTPITKTVNNKNLDVQITVQNTELQPFITQQSAIIPDVSDINTSGAIINDTPIDLLNIVAINEEIQKLISEQIQNPDTENQIIISEELAPEDKVNILSILSKLLNNNEENSEKLSLASVIEQIKTTFESEDSPIIITGLSPEQLTKLQDNIQKLSNDELDKDELKELEKLIAQFVILTPPNDKKPSKNVERATLQAVPEKSQAPTPAQNQIQDRFDARYDTRYDASKYDNNYKSPQPDIRDNNKGEFKDILKDASTAPSNDNAKNTLQFTGIIQNSGLSNDSLMQNTALTTITQNTQSPLQNSVTNIITQSQSAGASHPATQMVSATIQKAVKAGEDTNIKIKLDPPELGRVEVKMSIDKDNTTRIVLTAEKPETYLLLKQDSDILQRALNNAGLDTDGNLSFELASENHDFGDNNKRGNQSENRNGLSNDNDDGLIEATMDWQIDPDTGRMRYSVLV